jgi:hypothetical protein
MNPSGKKASVGAPQPSFATALQPMSSLAKKNTSSTDAIPITRILKSDLLDALQKLVACFVMEEGGLICIDRLGYISKIVQSSIEGFDTMCEAQTSRANQPAPATPHRVQYVVEETPLPTKKVSLAENLANMISTLANHKKRSIEVSRGHNKETQAIIFPPRTRNKNSFLNQARCSGWINDIIPEPHHIKLATYFTFAFHIRRIGCRRWPFKPYSMPPLEFFRHRVL